MKKHLRILYGADRRTEIVKNTIEICKNYFDTIRVLNTGPKEFESYFTDLPKNTSIETSEAFFGDLEMTRWNFLHDVDINDWVLYLDADERPSQLILHNLDFIIFDCEKHGYLKCRFPWVEHQAENPGVINHYHNVIKTTYPTNRKEWTGPKGSGVYAKDIFVKKVEDIHPITNFGGHGGYCSTVEYTVEKDNYFSHFVNHYKSQLAIHQSIVLSTWFSPFINVGTEFQKKYWEECKCFHLLVEFRKNNNVIMQNDLVRKIIIDKDEVFKSKLKQFLLQEEFKNSSDYYHWYKSYYIWANDYDCSLETPNSYCGMSCCNYDGIQY